MTSVLTRGLARLIDIGPARVAAAIVLVQAAMVIAVAGYAAQAGPREPFAGDWMDLAVPGGDVFSGGIAGLQRWDGLWYQHIARDGYAPDNGSTAFMPLYPLLGRLAAIPLFGNVALALVLVSCAAYVVALWLLARLVIREAAGLGARPGQARSLAIITMLVVASFPTAFFFVAPFTESLFLAFTLGSVLQARNGRLGWAGILGAGAALVRVQGVFLVLPLAWEALRVAGFIPLRGRPTATDLRRAIPGLLAAALPAVALAGWYLALSVTLGQPPIGVAAQERWGLNLVAPWAAVAASLAYIGAQAPHPMAGIEVLDLVCVFGVAALLVAARRLPVAHLLYAIASLVLVGSRVMFMLPLMSASRYVLAIYPGFMVLGGWLRRHPRTAVAWLALAAALQLVLVQWFARWGFVA